VLLLQVTKETEECRVKNLKQQQKMAMAKLDAHRCLIRDVVVQVRKSRHRFKYLEIQGVYFYKLFFQDNYELEKFHGKYI
jgi:hypothetical protein